MKPIAECSRVRTCHPTGAKPPGGVRPTLTEHFRCETMLFPRRGSRSQCTRRVMTLDLQFIAYPMRRRLCAYDERAFGCLEKWRGSSRDRLHCARIDCRLCLGNLHCRRCASVRARRGCCPSRREHRGLGSGRKGRRSFRQTTGRYDQDAGGVDPARQRRNRWSGCLLREGATERRHRHARDHDVCTRSPAEVGHQGHDAITEARATASTYRIDRDSSMMSLPTVAVPESSGCGQLPTTRLRHGLPWWPSLQSTLSPSGAAG